jgi:origin recognition complex subunit 4
VVELLEKRVKSRFSHRQIFIFPNEATDEDPFERRIELFCSLLSLPSEKKILPRTKKIKNVDTYDENLDDFAVPNIVLNKCKQTVKKFQSLDSTFVSLWNENVDALSKNEDVRSCLRKLYDIEVTEESLKRFLVCVSCFNRFHHSFTRNNRLF